MKKQSLLWFMAMSLAAWAGVPAFGQTGFYGGVSLRDSGGADATGLRLGNLPLAWNRFATPVVEDAPQRTLFGGYRWKSDVAVEAAFNANEMYALRPGWTGPVGGVGLTTTDPAAHTWNADVYTSWEFIRSLSLYGRLGYAQADARSLFAGASLVPGDAHRPREGVNYGLGLRYDMTQSLGLRVEYSRFGRFAGESTGTGLLPDSDQLMIGVQFKF